MAARVRAVFKEGAHEVLLQLVEPGKEDARRVMAKKLVATPERPVDDLVLLNSTMAPFSSPPR